MPTSLTQHTPTHPHFLSLFRGTYEIKLDELQRDQVVTGEYDLVVEAKKKKKKGEDEATQGKIELRLFYSLLTVSAMLLRTLLKYKHKSYF